MDKIQLEIVGLTQSKMQLQSYAIVLGEMEGNRRLPIVIGGFEAQAIAVAMEGVFPTRPLTHDLIRNLSLAFDIALKEVVISSLREGIFYSTLIYLKNDELIEVDSRTSDALALAVRFKCPIYTYESLMEKAGIVLEGEIKKKQPKKKGESGYSEHSQKELQDLLSDAITNEDYEKAAKIRDEIDSR